MTCTSTTSPPASRASHIPCAVPTGEFIIATIAPHVGATGVHTHSNDLSAGLVAAGCSCVVQHPLTHNVKWAAVFALRPLLLKRLNRTWSTWWLRHWHEAALRCGLIRYTKNRNIAAVIAQCPLAARAAMDARKAVGGTFAVCMVCHFNYSEANEYREKGELSGQRFFDSIQTMEKQVLESIDRVIYVSNWAQRVVEQEREIHPRASSVIWNGISAKAPPSSLNRSQFDLHPDDLVLINVGTLEPRKNQLALVELFAEITVDFPNARLVLVGDGPSRGQIELRLASLNLQSKVRLLGFRRDVPALLPLADMYVHASQLENCPISLIEAASAGLPIAAAPAGGVPELLRALGGVALDLNDPSSLRPLLNDARLRADAGRQAREAFEKHFTRDAMVQEYLRVLRQSPGGG